MSIRRVLFQKRTADSFRIIENDHAFVIQADAAFHRMSELIHEGYREVESDGRDYLFVKNDRPRTQTVHL